MSSLITRHFTYELRNQSGVLLARLPHAHNGRMDQALNEPSVLTFDLPVTSPNSANLIRSNEIWLYDSTMTIVNKFRITKRETSRDGDGKIIIRIVGDDYLGQLSDELVTSYTAAPEDNKTVTQIIQALLAFQVTSGSYDVNYNAGSIDATLGALVRSVNVQNQTILGAILSLVATTGGYIYVDPSTRNFTLAASLGSNTGQEIRYKKNLQGITQEIDYTLLTTRLYMYGANASNSDSTIKVRLPPIALVPTIFWSFNGTPNDVYALAATVNDLTGVGTPTYSSRGGPVGGDSIIFNGSSQYVYNAASKARQYSNHTVSGWFKLTANPGSGNAAIIYAESSTADADPIYAIEVRDDGTNRRLRVRIVDNAGVSQLSQTGSTNLALGTWYHFAVTDTAGSIRGYVNGALEIGPTAYTATLTINLSTLGAKKQLATVGSYLNGELASVRIHNSVMTAAQIAIDAVTTNEFMDSTQQSTYGLVPKVIVDQTITHPDTLLLVAKSYLEDHETPFTSYKIDACELSKTTRTVAESDGSMVGFGSFETIALGSTIRIVDEGLSITTTQIVTKKTTDLDSPIHVNFEIQNRTRLFTDPSTIYDVTQLYNSQVVDTIGAGQVIVRGSFTVADWVTGGTTTINGANITTGTVDADQLSVSVNGGVIKSGMTAYQTGQGFWLENFSGTAKLSMGDYSTTSNHITNGTFTTDITTGGWINSGAGGTWAWNSGSGGQARLTSGGNGAYIAQDANVLPGVTYTVAYTIRGSNLSGTKKMQCNLNGTAGIERTANGTYSEDIVAGNDATSALTIRVSTGSGVNADVDDVSVTGPSGSFMNWDGSSLIISGTIHARSIYAGTLYAARVPKLGNNDPTGNRLQTLSKGVMIWSNNGTIVFGPGLLSAMFQFPIEFESYPVAARVKYRITFWQTAGTISVNVYINGGLLDSYAISGGVPQDRTTADFNFNSSGVKSVTFAVSSTAPMNNGIEQVVIDSMSILHDVKGEHYSV